MRTMVSVLGMAVVMMHAGCIIEDFSDGVAEFANGCARNSAVNSAQVILRAGYGECKSVTVGTLVSFESGSATFKCTLRGGSSAGDVATPDTSSLIETAEPKTKALHEGKVSIVFDKPGTHAYYCEEDPGAAGAIYAK
jgi:plastocyanin